MQKIIKPWAETGEKIEPSTEGIVVADGWKPLDQPPAECWNHIQNERDVEQISDADARAVRLFGINPARMRGNDDRSIPIFRPFCFSGNDNLWYPEAACNMIEPLDGVQILDSSLGWDPAISMPIIVIHHSGGTPIMGGTYADLLFIRCWDYANTPITVEARRVNFGFNARGDVSSMPLLVCDGHLYVVPTEYDSRDRRILRYDLASWTGNPDVTLDLASYMPAGPYDLTEMVELEGGYVGFFAQRTTNNFVYFCRATKELDAFAFSASPATNVEVMQRVCRTNGTIAFAAGFDSDVYPQLIRAVTVLPTSAPSVFSAGGAFDHYSIVDFFPLRSDVDHPDGNVDVACLIHKDAAPYGPFVIVASYDGSFGFGESFGFSATDMIFDWQNPGCFCAFGTSAFALLNRRHGDSGESGGYSDYAQLVKIDPTYFLTAEGDQTLCNAANTGPFVGAPITGDFVSSRLNVRALHDGQSVWVIDMIACTVRRVVAPERRG